LCHHSIQPKPTTGSKISEDADSYKHAADGKRNIVGSRHTLDAQYPKILATNTKDCESVSCLVQELGYPITGTVPGNIIPVSQPRVVFWSAHVGARIVASDGDRTN
jgi:hypothetical protein